MHENENDTMTNHMLSIWIDGLTLKERAAVANFSNVELASEVEKCWLFNEWLHLPPFKDNKQLFKKRLTKLGLDDKKFNALLNNAVPLELNKAPLDWALCIEKLYGHERKDQAISDTVKSYPTLQKLELLKITLPVIVKDVNALENSLQNIYQGSIQVFDVKHTINVLLDGLLDRLAKTFSRTLVLEMHVAKQKGLLKGSSPEQRYQDYIKLLSNPQFAYQLLLEYPVLARKLITTVEQWKERCFEFIGHLVTDYRQLESEFSSDTPLGQFSGLDLESGDSHKKGQRVLIANFTSGTKIVYKPRSISIERHFQELLTWINQKSNRSKFKTIRVIDKEQYGWVEFVPYKQCNSKAQLSRFYRQLGCLKAVLFSLRATDFHHENFIACGEQPIAIDLETLFQTKIVGKFAFSNCFSVLDMDLLPTKDENNNTLDASGMGANKNAKIKSSSWSGGKTDELTLGETEFSLDFILSKPSDKFNARDFTNEISAGFSQIYQLIKENSDELMSPSGPLNRFLGDSSRLVFKATQTYSDILWESYHPTFFRSGLKTSKLLDNLWLAWNTNAITEELIEHETTDIENHDIPYFESNIGANSIKAASGDQVNFEVAESSLNLVKRHIQSFSDNHLKAQLWLINMSLRQVSSNAELKKPKQSNPFLSNLLSPSYCNFLKQAEKVGDLLQEIALQDDSHAIWAGQFCGDDDLEFNYLGSSLYDGQLGIIWFLAHLAKVSHKKRYKKLAEKGIEFCLANLLESDLVRPSIGLFNGLGSYLYVLSHLLKLWPEKNYSIHIQKIIAVLPSKIAKDKELDIISGAAGCLIALQSYYAINPQDDILQLCQLCGDKLINDAITTEYGIAWQRPQQLVPLAGISHGSSGMTLALARLSKITKNKKYLAAAIQGTEHENSLYSSEDHNWPDLRKRTDGTTINRAGWAWCSGATGITLNRIELTQQLSTPYQSIAKSDLALAISSTLSNSWPKHYALCHGSFGNLDILAYIAEKIYDKKLAHQCSHGLAESLQQWAKPYNNFQGTLKKIPSIGLMNGSTGIGYALLRQADSSIVPSILAMQAPMKT